MKIGTTRRRTKKRRVLHVLKYYRPQFTGEGMFMERCCSFMQLADPQTEHHLLVTVTEEPAIVPPACSALSRIIYLTRYPLAGWKRELTLLLWFVCNIHRYQTVHIRTHINWYFIAYLFIKMMRRRLVLSATLDDSVPVLIGQYRPWLRPVIFRLFLLFDVFVSVSPKLHQETSTVMPAERCELLPCGITLPWRDLNSRTVIRARYDIPMPALVLIFVGGLCARKDPMLLIRTLPEVLRRRPDTWLMLVGPPLEPGYVAEMERLAKELALDGRVIFVGEVANPHPYFAAADIMTFASHQEGFGMVVPEAQANGLPAVVRHLPGVNDLFVKDGETGLFFTDDKGYLEGVLRLSSDAGLRQRIGQQACDFVRKTFDMGQVARRYLSIYGCAGHPEPEPSTPAALLSVADIGHDASVVNPRFVTPAATERIERPILLTILDAEEEFDWTAPFSRNAIGVASMQHQEAAHRIFERFGVVPTYMVDYPVVCQPDGLIPLRDLLRDKRCDIGTQLHAWVTPPFREEVSVGNSYPGNLPPELELEKIRCMTEMIEQSLGVHPRIYRAGRYGVGMRTLDILKALGYQADSSVVPTWDFRAQQGPEFSAWTAVPCWLDADHTILEIPLAAAVTGRQAASRLLRRATFSSLGERLGMQSLTSRLELLERIKLTPEGITVKEAKRLIWHMLTHGQKVFVLSYHTPSLVPGNTPYVRTQDDLHHFLAWLDEIYTYFAEEVGGTFGRWSEVRDALQERPERTAEPLSRTSPSAFVKHAVPIGTTC